MSLAQPGSNNLGISGKSLYTGSRHGVPLSQGMAAKMAKHALTRHAGSLLFDREKEKHEQHPTCWCQRGVPNAADHIAVKGVADRKSVRLNGVITCKNVWACPTCSAKICASRGPEVERAMKAHIANGGYVFLVTRTFPHEMDMPLAELLKKEAKARAAFRNSRRWRDGKNARIGYICSLEVTRGDHGWHPHTHELIFATPDALGETRELDDQGRLGSRLIDELKEIWYECLYKAGLCTRAQMSDVLDHGLDVRGGQKAAEYVSKFGKDQKWGMSRELTAHPAKMGVKKGGGVHPFQLLAWSDGGDALAGDQYLEYVKAFQGKRMLSWSKGLKKQLLGEDEMTDEEAADLEEPDEVTLGRINSEALSVLHSRNLIANFHGYCAEYLFESADPQSDIDEYIAWAKTVPRSARGDVKVRMFSRSDEDVRGRKGFMFVDQEKARG